MKRGEIWTLQDKHYAFKAMVEEMINGRIAAGSDKGMVSVIDDANHIFIKYSVDAGKVDVYLVETYTN